MGAELIVAALEIEKGKTPNFDAARKHLEGISDEDLFQIYLSALGIEEQDSIIKQIMVRDAFSADLRTLPVRARDRSRVH